MFWKLQMKACMLLINPQPHTITNSNQSVWVLQLPYPLSSSNDADCSEACMMTHLLGDILQKEIGIWGLWCVTLGARGYYFLERHSRDFFDNWPLEPGWWCVYCIDETRQIGWTWVTLIAITGDKILPFFVWKLSFPLTKHQSHAKPKSIMIFQG